MNRRNLLLAILAAADGQTYEPVQVQKATFLIIRNIPALVDEGESYSFRPYDYGPFDSAVYEEAEGLEREGLALIRPSMIGRWKTYAASQQGIAEGGRILNGLAPEIRRYLVEVAGWVRSQSFSGLVTAIYQAYPEMRANSVFQGSRT
ncbi:hypothetical protein [Methylobacterium tarhaniae]|uniref:hypothetical protein n=1 Tax=Methylobacterium tarhaniae TaxID=1187852 RepID=UPI0012ED5D98|nr:hypothetical protein [Methylobacterium tarhaniae]